MSKDWIEPHEEEMLKIMQQNKLNKDFYNDLPSMVCEQLDKVWIPRFSEREWFEQAWEEYRQHIQDSDMDTMNMPMFVFKKYLSDEDLKNQPPYLKLTKQIRNEYGNS